MRSRGTGKFMCHEKQRHQIDACANFVKMAAPMRTQGWCYFVLLVANLCLLIARVAKRFLIERDYPTELFLPGTRNS